MNLHGLPLLRGVSDTVAQHGGEVISRARFLTEIKDLAEQLPDRTYVVNLCSDRYRFTVAWAAAMMRGQITLLPSGRDAASVAILLADYPALYVLTDDNETKGLPDPLFEYPAHLGAGRVGQDLAFPPDQVAAILFTSGSTGRSRPSPRRWGRLVAASVSAGAALGVERYRGAAVIATVPHAHSYGLESAVMLALQHGLLLTAGRPFFPADVVASLSDHPSILITTPIHLRALVGDAMAGESSSGFDPPPPLYVVLSATAPLSAQLAGDTEAMLGAPVFEIYGCSEAGQVAIRRTIDGPIWRCLDGLHLRQDVSGTWVSGPHEADVVLADTCELVGSDGFILQGRTADMVNVAGKRSSLAHLTGQLTAIEGVEDGVFLMPEDGDLGSPRRLAAIAVAPGLDAATIIAALRERIDPAFLPRPLHIVDRLPRNVLGKLPQAELIRLLEVVRAEPAPIFLHFPTDHPSGPGHFPGNPIVPGAVLLDELVATLFPGGWCGEIESVKFHQPIRPGDTVAVTHKTQGSVTHFECRLAVSSGSVPPARLAVSGSLKSASPSP